MNESFATKKYNKKDIQIIKMTQLY